MSSNRLTTRQIRTLHALVDATRLSSGRPTQLFNTASVDQRADRLVMHPGLHDLPDEALWVPPIDLTALEDLGLIAFWSRTEFEVTEEGVGLSDELRRESSRWIQAAHGEAGSAVDVQENLRGSARNTQGKKYKYDVAISFASPQRPLAEQLAQRLKSEGFEVFYDADYQEELWGKDLSTFFEQIYHKQSRYCVIFVSHAYLSREWTNFERQNAVARSIQERGNEYILPVKIDAVDLPGVPNTIGYLSINRYPIDRVAKILIAKLRK
jgi:hypothetical protein